MAVTHRYYRLLISSNNGGTYMGMAELEMAATAGGTNLATTGNGTPFASSVSQATSAPGVYVAAKAFDANMGTYWLANTTSSGEWIAWDFGAGNNKAIREIRIKQQAYGGITTTSSVKDAVFQYSDDGVNWTGVATITSNPSADGTYTYATSIGPESGTFLLNAPTPTITVFGGASFALTAPAPTLFAYGPGGAALQAPAPTLNSAGHNSYGENISLAIAPTPTLSAYGGANTALTSPAPTLSCSATGTALVTAALTAPAPKLSATGTVSAVAQFTLTAPVANLVGYGGAVCSITTPAGTLVASGTAGGVATAAVTVPMAQLSFIATAQNHGGALLVAPAGQMATGLQAYLVAPMATLTAIGSATITATYEAYAMNMNHTPRAQNGTPGASDPAVDEVTRYTNFPFDYVVRYLGSYYGANSTGLYLLEGTTDAGAPIAYAGKTHLTDLGYPEHKTLVSAYFGGRFGPAETVALTVGETGDQTYSYTTPRGVNAQTYRQHFGRGIKTRYFGLGVSGSGPFALDTIDLETDKLTRRI